MKISYQWAKEHPEDWIEINPKEWIKEKNKTQQNSR